MDVVPIEQARGAEALLERIFPNEVKIGEPFELRVVASSQTAQEATLRLFRDHAYIGAQEVSLSPGKNVVVFVQTLEKPGFHTYEARLEPRDDTLSENNRALGFCWCAVGRACSMSRAIPARELRRRPSLAADRCRRGQHDRNSAQPGGVSEL